MQSDNNFKQSMLATINSSPTDRLCVYRNSTGISPIHPVRPSPNQGLVCSDIHQEDY